MLNSLQQGDVWDEWYSSEVRANYFGDLVGRFQLTQKAITWGTLVMSSGAFVTLLTDWVPPQYKWVRPVLAAIAAALSFWSLIAKNEKNAIDCSDLYFQWSVLGREFKELWGNMYDEGSPEKLKSLLARTDELSRRCTSLPNKPEVVLKWQRYVTRRHLDRAA